MIVRKKRRKIKTREDKFYVGLPINLTLVSPLVDRKHEFDANPCEKRFSSWHTHRAKISRSTLPERASLQRGSNKLPRLTNKLRSQRVGVLLPPRDKKLSLQVAIARLCTASCGVRRNIWCIEKRRIYRDVIHMWREGQGCSPEETCVLYLVDPTRCALHVSNGHLSSKGAWNGRFA